MQLIYTTIENLWAYIDLLRRLSKHELMERGLFLAVSLLILNLLWPVAARMAIAIMQTFPHLPDKGLIYFCLAFLAMLVTILACVVICAVREMIKKSHSK